MEAVAIVIDWAMGDLSFITKGVFFSSLGTNLGDIETEQYRICKGVGSM